MIAAMADRGARYFTVDEAQALLPEVDALLARARAQVARVQGLEGGAGEPQPGHRRNGHVQHDTMDQAPTREREQAATELRTIVTRLGELGVIVRDIRAGLVDFPTLRGGREVYLCWRVGEPHAIRWWHEVDAGFQGRQPLD